MTTKLEKLDFIINKLNNLKGLEFIDSDEIAAVNYANMILRRTREKLDKAKKINGNN